MRFNKKDEGSPERVTVPVLKDSENTAISNEDKAEIIAKTLTESHSSNKRGNFRTFTEISVNVG